MLTLIHGWNTPVVIITNQTMAPLHNWFFSPQPRSKGMKNEEWVKE
jgi:hypothetical protein